MLKSIKKSFKYLIIFVGIIILVPTFFSLILRIPEVQTFIVNRITRHISENLKSTILVGKVEYSFFNKITLTDLLIKDQNNDTLIYSQKLTANISRIDLSKKIVRLGHVELQKPLIALITDTSGISNLSWYINKLGSSERKGERNGSSISIKQANIREGRFFYINKNDIKPENTLDFNNLRFSGINGDIDEFKVMNDSVSFRVNDLEFSESKGFLVRSMNSKILYTDLGLSFRDIFLYLDSSIINSDHIIISTDSGSFKDFTNNVKLNIDFQKSLVSGADLRFFVPSLKGLEESVEISGRISGSVAELKGRNIRVSYRNQTSIDCDFDFSGLPKIEDTFIHIEVNSLKTSGKDIESIKLPNKRILTLPEIIYKLGVITYNGSFSGFLTDFVTYGRLGTDVGTISTDISMRPDEKSRFRIKGLVKCTNIDLGILTGKSDILGRISMETNVDGFASSAEKISGNLKGKIDSVEINGYLYRNVALNGIFTEKTWDGNIKISDRNIKMDMMGMFDFSKSLPEFDFTLNLAEANLYKLHFDKADSSSHVSLIATANFRGNNIDNLFGEIRLLNSTIRKYGKDLELYDFSLRAFNENSKPAISLRTDFLDADLKGNYRFREIGNTIKTAMASIMPSMFKPAVTVKGKNLPRNKFTYTLNFKNTDKINSFFKTGLLLSEKSTISGSFYQDSLIKVNANARMLNYRNNILNNLILEATYAGTGFDADLKSSLFSILGQSGLKDFKAGIKTKPDSFVFTMGWDNKEKSLSKGSFIASGTLIPRTIGKVGALLRIDIDSSEIIAGNNPWRISQSTVTIDSGRTQIGKFMVASRNSSYTIDGTVSGNREDTLKLKFVGIDLSPLGRTGQRNGDNTVSAIPFNPKGIVNGNILLSSALRNPLIETNIRVNDFSLLGGNFGDISIISLWNSATKVADINAYNNLNGKNNFDIKGYYDPGIKEINLKAKATNLPVEALNPLLSFFASGITGTASGKLNLTGAPGRFVLNGSLMAENTSMRVDYLKTKYKINDSIRFDKAGIKFRNVKVADERGNNAVLSGAVYHKYFKDFAADITITMDKNDVFVLNTQQRDNEMFYGTAYGTGVTKIKSDPNTLSFDISAKTGKGTRVYIPLNSGMSVSSYSFVSFINRDTSKSDTDKKSKIVPGKPAGSMLDMNFDLDVTPDAEVQLLIDPKAGDVIRGRGTGKLNISLNKKGEFKIYGDYIIEQGDYLFTLQNILNKRFDVESGGKIMFNGDVENAEIDLIAKYKNLKTSLYPILQDERYNTRIPVEPQLELSGNLFNPVVKFNIYLPNADEETRTYLRNAIATDEELSRQFLYLLVMNSFYADPSYRASAGISSSSPSAMAVTTTEMLSNQLSNWLSQISNDFDVGFVYRPGTKEINSQELEVALSTQLLNDKVTINGNVDVRGANNPGGAPLTGDFDIEYKITEKIRFKVFNRYNNPYTGRLVPYTQGLGVFFKQDFNKFSDLLRKKEKPAMKKEDEVKVQ